MKIGRNDPCPCGSGKKYKKCCLAADTAAAAAAARQQALVPFGEPERSPVDRRRAAERLRALAGAAPRGKGRKNK